MGVPRVASHTAKFGRAAVYPILVTFHCDWTETCQSPYKLSKVDRFNTRPSQQIINTQLISITEILGKQHH